jgi:hypothetical protein
MSSSTVATQAVARRSAAAPTRPRLPVGLIAGAVVAGSAGVLAVSSLGSGDYGQWLMAARPYLGEGIPAYRAGNAVPPVVPAFIAVVARVVPNGATAIHIAAVLLLVALATAAYLAGTVLFRSRLAGVLAVVGSFLLTDLYFDLFAFGGLLQAGAIVWMLLAAAAFGAAARRHRRSSMLNLIGVLCVGLGALTHMGTAVIAVPVGIELAFLSAIRAAPDRQSRQRRLVPLGAVLAAVAVVWLLVLLPGGTELARNPASLSYRGPDRLVAALTAYWPTIALAFVGAAGITLGTLGEVRRRRPGSWVMLAAWLATTAGVVLASVVEGASTDYPRFATPLLAPLILGAAGIMAYGVARLAGAVATRTHRGSRRAWAVGLLALAVIVSTPASVGRFTDQLRGYALSDAVGLDRVAAWVEATQPQGGTILAPVREAKWLEGLTGRATLFSGSIRYSFRPAEWQRSLAADALLRGNGALVNSYFVARFADPDATDPSPRTLTIAANHGGEYVDLLRTVPLATTIGHPGGGVVARLANLPPGTASSTRSVESAASTFRWEGSRPTGTVAYRQTVTLAADGSTLDLTAETSGTAHPTDITLALRPTGTPPLVTATADGRELSLVFGTLGSTAPRLRLVAGDGATIRASADGTVLVHGEGPSVQLSVTDLTGSPVTSVSPALLDPSTVLTTYGVTAAVLPRDSLLDARRARLEALGFRLAADFGSYLAFDRSEPGP